MSDEYDTEDKSEEEESETYSAEDEAEPSNQSGSESVSQTPRLFGRTRGLIRAPKPDVSLGSKIVKKTVAKTAGAVALPAITTTSKGFWKVLGKFDVSETSAPGQIIIPKIFRDFFPATVPSEGSGAGYQSEVSFRLLFVDGRFSEIVPEARYVHYVPKPGHPRPNVDDRFTFHNKSIRQRLKKFDILVFRLSDNSALQFEVERISQSDPRYARLYSGKGSSYGRLS